MAPNYAIPMKNWNLYLSEMRGSNRQVRVKMNEGPAEINHHYVRPVNKRTTTLRSAWPGEQVNLAVVGPGPNPLGMLRW